MSIRTTKYGDIDVPVSERGTPTWEIALMHPYQGEWTEEQYLRLDYGKLIEFTDGVLDFLTMPTLPHQRIVMEIFDGFRQYLRDDRRAVYFAPCPIRLRPGMLREPDVYVISPERIKNLKEPGDGADLVVEIINEGLESRQRDLVTKRVEYAEAGVPEYWIVDPDTTTVTVLTLDGAEYRTHGEFRPGDKADSVLLEGFDIDVTALFDAGTGPTK